MAFVNEYISAEDRKKYGLDDLDNDQSMQARAPQRSWTIDHEREIYIRVIDRGREEFSHQSTWTFYWHGELLIIDLVLVDGAGNRGEAGWSRWKVHHLAIPQYLESSRDEIIGDLKAALTAYKDGGVFSANTSYTITLDV